MHRSILEVLGVIAAYNAFMKCMDRMDQLRPGSSARRRKVRFYMSILSCLMYLEVYNGYAV